jgi:DNA-binding transcriptional ArsR family regulator
MLKYNTPLDYLFHALSDPTRREIMQLTLSDPKTVSDIAAKFDMSLSAISQHLKVLEQAKLIRRHKDGRTHWIYAQPDALKEIDQWVTGYEKFWSETLDGLDAFLSNPTPKE